MHRNRPLNIFIQLKKIEKLTVEKQHAQILAQAVQASGMSRYTLGTIRRKILPPPRNLNFTMWI